MTSTIVVHGPRAEKMKFRAVSETTSGIERRFHPFGSGSPKTSWPASAINFSAADQSVILRK